MRAVSRYQTVCKGGPFRPIFCFSASLTDVPIRSWMIRKDEKQRKGNTAKKETQEVIMENETRIAVIGIIIEDKSQAGAVNELLHQYGNYIIGRMGLPYEKKKVNIISIVLDAPGDIISALSGKLGRLWGVSSKALYTKTGEKACEEQRREE